MSVGCRATRENEVDYWSMVTTKFYDLRIIGLEKFYEKSVCHKIEGVQLRFVQIQHFKTIQQNRHAFTLYRV